MVLRVNITEIDSVSLHKFSRLVAGSRNDSSWLDIYSRDYVGKERNDLCIFMPLRLAEMLEAAFHAYGDEVSGQETVSAYADVIADPPRQGAEARALK